MLSNQPDQTQQQFSAAVKHDALDCAISEAQDLALSLDMLIDSLIPEEDDEHNIRPSLFAVLDSLRQKLDELHTLGDIIALNIAGRPE